MTILLSKCSNVKRRKYCSRVEKFLSLAGCHRSIRTYSLPAMIYSPRRRTNIGNRDISRDRKLIRRRCIRRREQQTRGMMLYACVQRLPFTSEHLATASVYNLQADFHKPGKFIITCSRLLMAPSFAPTSPCLTG